MKTFNPDHYPWKYKVNFVDDNNVLVGYDLSQQCCEQASWFITDLPIDLENIIPATQDQPLDLPGYNFDPSYRVTHTPSILDEGSITSFRLTNSKGDEKFLHLYNCHNGYYSHGFTFQAPDQPLEEGCL